MNDYPPLEINKPITWQELKDFVNALPEEQLDKQCYILLDDNSTGTPVLQPSILEEDIYVNDDLQEDCGTLDQLREIHEEEFKLEDYRLATKAGTPFLWAET